MLVVACEQGCKGRVTEDKSTFQLMGLFIILIVVVTSWGSTYVKTTSKCVILVYINSILIKLS